MPLTPRERKAIWHARQHYLREFLFLLDTEPETVTPSAFIAASRFTLTTILDRIAAENPDQPEPTYCGSPYPSEPPCPPSPTTNPPAAPSSSSSEIVGLVRPAP